LYPWKLTDDQRVERKRRCEFLLQTLEVMKAYANMKTVCKHVKDIVYPHGDPVIAALWDQSAAALLKIMQTPGRTPYWAAQIMFKFIFTMVQRSIDVRKVSANLTVILRDWIEEDGSNHVEANPPYDQETLHLQKLSNDLEKTFFLDWRPRLYVSELPMTGTDTAFYDWELLSGTLADTIRLASHQGIPSGARRAGVATKPEMNRLWEQSKASMLAVIETKPTYEMFMRVPEYKEFKAAREAIRHSDASWPEYQRAEPLDTSDLLHESATNMLVFLRQVLRYCHAQAQLPASSYRAPELPIQTGEEYIQNAVHYAHGHFESWILDTHVPVQNPWLSLHDWLNWLKQMARKRQLPDS
jgi:hypothetical protein